MPFVFVQQSLTWQINCQSVLLWGKLHSNFAYLEKVSECFFTWTVTSGPFFHASWIPKGIHASSFTRWEQAYMTRWYKLGKTIWNDFRALRNLENWSSWHLVSVQANKKLHETTEAVVVYSDNSQLLRL